jgi:hypothetical protein
MTTYYLASRYSRRIELRRYRKQLIAAGHDVISKWLFGDAGETAANAMRDCRDIEKCSSIILWCEKPRTATRGGRHFELGYAAALRKELIAIGDEAEHIFLNLPSLKMYPTFADFIATLTRPTLRHKSIKDQQNESRTIA